VRAVLDGELVAFGPDAKPDFERVCECTLQRHGGIPLTFLAFDVLSVGGRDVTRDPYRAAPTDRRSAGARRPAVARAGGI
jgi:ATP-dependent DNA ligase